MAKTNIATFDLDSDYDIMPMKRIRISTGTEGEDQFDFSFNLHSRNSKKDMVEYLEAVGVMILLGLSKNIERHSNASNGAENDDSDYNDDTTTSNSKSSHWVRRSARQPSRSAVEGPNVQKCIKRIKSNDPDIVVFKCKKYLSDPDTPPVVIDAMLDALQTNTNCQALYIQVSTLYLSSFNIFHIPSTFVFSI